MYPLEGGKHLEQRDRKTFSPKEMGGGAFLLEKRATTKRGGSRKERKKRVGKQTKNHQKVAFYASKIGGTMKVYTSEKTSHDRGGGERREWREGVVDRGRLVLVCSY